MTDDIIIKFNQGEMLQGAMMGVMRQLNSIHKKRSEAHKANRADVGWQIDIEGALGELAVAKWLDVYHTGVAPVCAVDVGNLTDVRTTPYHTGNLILHHSDEDERSFFLVTGYSGMYRIRGWCYGHEGKQECYWKKTYEDKDGNEKKLREPCFMVPIKDLRSPKSFYEKVKNGGDVLPHEQEPT